MDLSLKRYSITDTGAYGWFLDYSGNIITYTLEHTYQDPGTKLWLPKIVSGTYTCQRRMSPHFGFELFCLVGVPGHDFIEIHKGNYEKDSQGCILVGSSVLGDALQKSDDAFTKLMNLQSGLQTFQLTVG